MCCPWRNGISCSEAAVTELLTWQIVDSAFPTGTFTHSWGLEAAWQFGELPDAGALRGFVDRALLQAGYAHLPFLNEAYRDPEALAALDERADTFLINTVANRASRMQGRTLLATAARIWPSARVTRVQTLAGDTRAHVAPLSGAVFDALGLPLPTAQRVVLFGTARAVLSAAVRLGIVGSYDAQRLQYACGSRVEAIAERCASLALEDVAQTAPLIDLLQAGHDRLYSRLFQS
jgi:urease accessory protein